MHEHISDELQPELICAWVDSQYPKSRMEYLVPVEIGLLGQRFFFVMLAMQYIPLQGYGSCLMEAGSTLLVFPPIYCQRPQGARDQPKRSGQGGIHQYLSRDRFLRRHGLHAHDCHFRTLCQHRVNLLLCL